MTVDEAGNVMDYCTALSMKANQGTFTVRFVQINEGNLEEGGYYASPLAKGDPVMLDTTNDNTVVAVTDGSVVFGWVKIAPKGKVPTGTDGASVAVASQTLMDVVIWLNPKVGSIKRIVAVDGTAGACIPGSKLQAAGSGKFKLSTDNGYEEGVSLEDVATTGEFDVEAVF